MVIQKAKELGYHQFPDDFLGSNAPSPQPPRGQNIAFLTNRMPTESSSPSMPAVCSTAICAGRRPCFISSADISCSVSVKYLMEKVPYRRQPGAW